MMIERFGHGGDLVTAQSLFAIEEAEWLDFSSNIYPYGPPSLVLGIIKQELDRPGVPVLSRYPDPDARALRQAIARFHRVDAAQVTVGNGAAELIDLIVQTLLPSRVGVIQPAFVEYAFSAEKRGIPVESVYTSWENGFLPGQSQWERLIREVDLLFVGRPNNPTGHLFPYELLEQMATWAERWKTWLVVDEAFLDFVDSGKNRSALQLLAVNRRVLVLRSLTKFFALPGLRLGYVVAAPDVSERLQMMRTPWNVNGLALTVGEVLMHPDVYQAHAQKVHDWLSGERSRLVREWGKLPGVTFFPSEANYALGRVADGKKQADELQRACAAQGMLIRLCANYPGLGAAYFRIAIKKPEENDRLLAMLRSWFG